jgi:hypothetical protein
LARHSPYAIIEKVVKEVIAGRNRAVLTGKHLSGGHRTAVHIGRQTCDHREARFEEQFPKPDRSRELLRYICARITASAPLQQRPIAAIATG